MTALEFCAKRPLIEPQSQTNPDSSPMRPGLSAKYNCDNFYALIKRNEPCHSGSKAPLKSGPSALLDEGGSAIFLRGAIGQPAKSRTLRSKISKPKSQNLRLDEPVLSMPVQFEIL